MTFPSGHVPTIAADWPVFDELGWADYWSIDDWTTWHKANVAAYGLATANSRFLQAWNEDSLIHSAPLDARSFNSSFRQYAKDNGFFDALYGGALAVLAKPLGILSDTGDAVSSIGEGIKSSGSWFKYLIPFAAVALLYVYANRAAGPGGLPKFKLPVK